MRSQPGIRMGSTQSQPTRIHCRCGAVVYSLAADEAVYPKGRGSQHGAVRVEEGECAECHVMFRIEVTTVPST